MKTEEIGMSMPLVGTPPAIWSRGRYGGPVAVLLLPLVYTIFFISDINLLVLQVKEKP